MVNTTSGQRLICTKESNNTLVTLDGRHHCIHLQRAYDKHGEAAFIIEVLNVGPDFREQEQTILDEGIKVGMYNVSSTASGGDMISNHPDRARIVVAATLRSRAAKQPDPKFRESNPNWKGGICFCDCGARKAYGAKTCHACGDRTGPNNSFYGKHHNKKVIEKMRKERAGKYVGPQEREVRIDAVVYKSVSEAARAIGCVPATIINRIRNKKFESYAYV